jgi:hypothetical protein
MAYVPGIFALRYAHLLTLRCSVDARMHARTAVSWPSAWRPLHPLASITDHRAHDHGDAEGCVDLHHASLYTFIGAAVSPYK